MGTAALSDEKSAIQAVFEAHYPFLRLVARQYVRSPADADDIVQEGLLRFWKYARECAADTKAYLAACVKNAALDFLRTRQNRKEELAGLASGAGQQPLPLFECSLELEESRAVLEEALKQLPVEQRVVVVLKIWGELTFPQIGELMGVSHDTAASRYRYALTALRQRLTARAAPGEI
jgi:RNA polymerase sigma-70 factor (ECF subfamily)